MAAAVNVYAPLSYVREVPDPGQPGHRIVKGHTASITSTDEEFRGFLLWKTVKAFGMDVSADSEACWLFNSTQAGRAI